MSDINAAPSSTEPAVTGEPLPPSDNPLTQEAGVAASGEPSAAQDAAASTPANATDSADASLIPMGNGAALDGADAGNAAASPAAGQSEIDSAAHLSLLDAMLAEIERKIAAGIHLFAHEVTAARDHLAKLL